MCLVRICKIKRLTLCANKVTFFTKCTFDIVQHDFGSGFIAETRLALMRIRMPGLTQSSPSMAEIAASMAAATYLLTMEPTASFWDCGEFISSAVKLDVGHPPGAPFFMLMGHFFSLFASDTEHLAMCVNALSALASAFTILFLFWTITALAKKLVQPDTMAKGIGSGAGVPV